MMQKLSPIVQLWAERALGFGGGSKMAQKWFKNGPKWLRMGSIESAIGGQSGGRAGRVWRSLEAADAHWPITVADWFC